MHINRLPYSISYTTYATEAILGTFVCCAIVAALINVANLYFFILGFRADRNNALKGRWKLISASKPSTTFALMGTLRFLGASTIYAVCAFILMTFSLFAACFFITYSIVLPALGILVDWFWEPFFVNWLLWQNGSPGLLTTFLILLICIYVFIYVSFRASSRVVAIKNRVFYANFELFCIIFYLFVGLLSTLLRLAVGLILGLGVISRVDKVMYM